jgi:hypothetical protein
MDNCLLKAIKIDNYFRLFFVSEAKIERLCDCKKGHKTSEEAMFCDVAVKNGIELVVNYM